MCEISCVLEGEDLVDSEDMKDLNVSDIVCYSMQDWYHVTWNVHILNTNHSSVISDTDLRCTT
jgi:hypothetical protein